MAERDPKTGQFVPGHSLATGRPKGHVNKATENIKRMVTNLVEQGLQTFQQDLMFLEPKDRIKAVTELLAYTMPKKSFLNHEDLASSGLTINFNGVAPDDLDKLLQASSKDNYEEAKIIEDDKE